MIAYIKGIIALRGENEVVIESNGIGYQLVVSSNCANTVQIGDELTLYTFLKIRETDISLFGFIDAEERSLFMSLCDVSGIGGRSAIQILSGCPTVELVAAIVRKDVAKLSAIKGIGKKTAERIVVELCDKLSEKFAAMSVSDKQTGDAQAENDAIIGLMSLGFTRVESERAVEKVVSDGATGLENIISRAIKQLSR